MVNVEMYELYLDSNKKDEYLRLLELFCNHLSGNKRNKTKSKYVKIIYAKVKASDSDKIIFYHTDFRYVAKARKAENDILFQDHTNKAFLRIKNDIDKFNESFLRGNQYWLAVDRIFIKLIDNPFYAVACERAEEFKEDFISENNYYIINNTNITQNITVNNSINLHMSFQEKESNIDSGSNKILNNLPPAVSNFIYAIKYSLISPEKIHTLKGNNFAWISRSVFLFLFSYYVIASVLLMNVPDLIKSDLADFYISMRSELVSFKSFLISLLGYFIYMSIFLFPFLKLSKAKVLLGQLVFANMIPVFIFLLFGMNFIFPKILSPSPELSMGDVHIFYATIAFIIFHFRTLYKVACIKLWKFSGIYATSILVIASFGRLMSVVKGF